jgi:hypothetical protein
MTKLTLLAAASALMIAASTLPMQAQAASGSAAVESSKIAAKLPYADHDVGSPAAPRESVAVPFKIERRLQRDASRSDAR